MKQPFLIAAFLCMLVFGMATMQMEEIVRSTQDTNVYREIGQQVEAGGAINSQYPPLASALFGIVQGNPFGLSFSWAWIMMLILTVFTASAYAYKRLGKSDVLYLPLSLLLTAVLIGPSLVAARYDVLIGILLFLTWRSHMHQRVRAAGVFLLLASAFKLVPLLLLPVFWALTARKKRWIFIRGCVEGGVISVLLPMLYLGPLRMMQNTWYLLSYHGSRTIQIESTWSSIHLLYSKLVQHKPVIEFHALSVQNMAFPPAFAYAVLILLLLGLGVIVFCVLRTKKIADAPLVPALTLLWMLAVSPILSPQYFIWVMPILITLFVERVQTDKNISRLAVILGGSALALPLMTQWIFPHHYGDIIEWKSTFTILVLFLRNILLCGFVLFLSHHTFRWKLPFPLYSPSVRQKSIAALLLLLLLGGSYLSLGSVVGEATYGFKDETKMQGQFPVFIEGKGKEMYFSVTVTQRLIHPILFRIKPDDCILALWINDQPVDPSLAEFCSYDPGRDLNLSPYLVNGENSLIFVIQDHGGKAGLDLRVANSDPLLLLTKIGLLFVLLWTGMLIIRHTSRSKLLATLFMIMLIGFLLRSHYAFFTPYTERGHDTGAHIDYIEYVADHFKLPPAQDGWEFHQPPLYYFLTGTWYTVGRLAGLDRETLLNVVQFFALLLSFATLAVGVWIGKRSFLANDWLSQLCYAGIIAVFPTLILFSNRINNDVLYQFLVFSTFAALLLWWQSHRWTHWYLIAVLLGLTTITKMSGLTLLPVCGLCLLAMRSVSFPQKIWHGTVFLLVVLIIAGWVPLVRFIMEQDPTRLTTMGNQGMDDALAVSNAPVDYLTFNPLTVITIPFVNPWEEATRRTYFWEYFFRSAFSGEFHFEPPLDSISVLLRIAGILLLLPFFGGMYVCLRKQWMKALPFLLTLLFVLLAAMAYRFNFSYAPNQDFRFSILAVIPIAFFIVHGIQSAPKTLRSAGVMLLVSESLLSALFFLLAPFF